jgi:hypothetical protein
MCHFTAACLVVGSPRVTEECLLQLSRLAEASARVRVRSRAPCGNLQSKPLVLLLSWRFAPSFRSLKRKRLQGGTFSILLGGGLGPS